MIDAERINSQLSFLREKAIASFDPGGDRQSTQRGSIVNFHFCCEKMIASVDPGGIDAPETFHAWHGLATSVL